MGQSSFVYQWEYSYSFGILKKYDNYDDNDENAIIFPCFEQFPAIKHRMFFYSCFFSTVVVPRYIETIIIKKNEQDRAIDDENATIVVIFFILIVHRQIFESKTEFTIL